MNIVRDFIDENGNNRSFKLESTFFHEVGHVIVSKIYHDLIIKTKFQHDITLIPYMTSVMGASLSNQSMPPEYKIAELFSGCIFEKVFEFWRNNMMVDLSDCWYLENGSGSKDREEVRQILVELGDVLLDNEADIFNLTNSYLKKLCSGFKTFQLEKLFQILPENFLRVEKYEPPHPDVFKVNMEELEEAINDFLLQYFAILETEFIPELKRILNKI